MNNTRKPVHRKVLRGSWLRVACVLWVGLPLGSHAEIKLSSDWNSEKTCTGSPRTAEELALMQRGLMPKPVCTKSESEKVDEASAKSAIPRAAVKDYSDPNKRVYEHDRGFKLQIDGLQHYLEPLMFMTKSKPDEVCTRADSKGMPRYQCKEGQRRTEDCHILVFNDQFEEVGYHRIEVKEPYQFFCNAVPAIGVADAKNNLILATVQYFPIDRKLASKVSEIGDGWNRMTVALRLKRQEDGRVWIEQEDACLGNPNRIETVPDAKRKLKGCAASSFSRPKDPLQ